MIAIIGAGIAGMFAARAQFTLARKLVSYPSGPNRHCAPTFRERAARSFDAVAGSTAAPYIVSPGSVWGPRTTTASIWVGPWKRGAVA